MLAEVLNFLNIALNNIFATTKNAVWHLTGAQQVELPQPFANLPVGSARQLVRKLKKQVRALCSDVDISRRVELAHSQAHRCVKWEGKWARVEPSAAAATTVAVSRRRPRPLD
eukprot:scaffold11.g3987.t1